MTKGVVRTFYTPNYIQKSMAMLLPLVEDDYVKTRKNGLLNTYLYCEGIEESILENFLLVEFSKDSTYEGNRYTQACYTTEEDTEVLVYNLDHIREDVQKFLKGQYSRYSKGSKKKLLEYYGHRPPSKPEDVKNGVREQAWWYVILYPDTFVQEVSNELWKKYGLYTTYKEAYDFVKDMKETLPLFDLDKETLNKRILE